MQVVGRLDEVPESSCLETADGRTLRCRATCRSPVDLVAAHVVHLLRDLPFISERIEEEEHTVSVVLIERFLKDG